MIRHRDAALVRADALNMAIKKAVAGCRDCAAGYFAVARSHGATDDDIDRAIATTSDLGTASLTRLEALKLAAAGAASLTLGTIGLQPQLVEAACTGNYWGTDSSTQSCCGLPQDFYIGQIGHGISTANVIFNTTAANAAGYAATYSYWTVEGPGSPNRPAGITDYAWGQKQGLAAFNEWANGAIGLNYCGGATIFADVESGNYGWTNYNYVPNQQVLKGWLDQVASNVPHVGLYTNPTDWTNICGQSYRLNRSVVLWVTGCMTCASSISCKPCNTTCSTTRCQVNNLLSSGTNPVSAIVIGGSQAVLWQYYIDSCGCGDFDVSLQNPNNPVLNAVTSSSTYHATGC